MRQYLMKKEDLREEFVTEKEYLRWLYTRGAKSEYADDMPDLSVNEAIAAITEGRIEALKTIAHNQNPHLLYMNIEDALYEANKAIEKVNRLIKARANFNGHEPSYLYSIQMQETEYL